MSASPVKREAAPSLPFDPRRLERFLKEALPALKGDIQVEPVAGGQSNPTYFVTVGDRRLVLRKKPGGPILPSAHAVDREYRVQHALRGTGVPVAGMLLYHGNDDDIVGTPFYVMERVEGRIFADSALAAAPESERRAMYRSVAETLAAIHAVDIDAVGLGDFGRKGAYVRRQIERWSKQWMLSKIDVIPEIDLLAKWLRDNLPADDRTTLVHGDFRIGNLIFHPTEPRVVAVLDWELSTLGDPLADLAHSCIYGWHIRPEEYGGLLGLDLAAQGLPTLEEFVADYAAAVKATGGLTAYHLAFALFRNAVIFAGIAARARDGNASAANAAEIGALAPIFAKRGLGMTTGDSTP